MQFVRRMWRDGRWSGTEACSTENRSEKEIITGYVLYMHNM